MVTHDPLRILISLGIEIENSILMTPEKRDKQNCNQNGKHLSTSRQILSHHRMKQSNHKDVFQEQQRQSNISLHLSSAKCPSADHQYTSLVFLLIIQQIQWTLTAVSAHLAVDRRREGASVSEPSVFQMWPGLEFKGDWKQTDEKVHICCMMPFVDCFPNKRKNNWIPKKNERN